MVYKATDYKQQQCAEVQPLTDCKGRALRVVQEKGSAQVKGEVP